MSGMGKGYYFFMMTRRSDDQEDDEWRALHRRPDALPLPAEPETPNRSLASRIVGLVPVLRRLVVDQR